MNQQNIGIVKAISGNLVSVEFDHQAMQNEMAYVLSGGNRLKSEVIRIHGSRAELQVFEETRGLKVGDKVEVSMRKSLGTKAVMLGYFLPFLLVVATLIISLSLSVGPGLSGLASLSILVPYYMILYRSRNQLKRTFVFYIR